MMKKNQERLGGWLLGLLMGVALGAGFLALRGQTRPAPIVIQPAAPTGTPLPTATVGPIRVFVNGEVVSPGVYALPPDGIVEQAIEAAGGFTLRAETAVVNLAYPLQAGLQIMVPAQGVPTPTPAPVIILPEATNGGGGARIDINRATAAELDGLPGIGPSTAAKIVAYREANGDFEAIADLMQVSGIGAAKFEQIKDLVTAGGG